MANDNVWIMYTRDTAQTLMTFFFKDIGLNRGTAKWTEKSQDRKSSSPNFSNHDTRIG